MIEIKNISKTFDKKSKYPVKALSDINLNINDNEITGLIGANGAGKTTLIRIILGFETPDSGYVKINNLSNNDIEIKKIVGYQSDLPYVSKYVSIRDYLNLNAELLGLSNYNNQIDEMLDYFDILTASNKKLSELSKGMRQKVEIINAFLGNPKIVILDEPTAALDPIVVINLRNFILTKKQSGISVLFSSHHLSEVENICDRVIFIDRGVIVKDLSRKDFENTSLEEEFTKIIGDGKK